MKNERDVIVEALSRTDNQIHMDERDGSVVIWNKRQRSIRISFDDDGNVTAALLGKVSIEDIDDMLRQIPD